MRGDLVKVTNLLLLEMHLDKITKGSFQLLLDQLLEDSEKGEIKPGLDEKNNPVWTVINPTKATARQRGIY